MTGSASSSPCSAPMGHRARQHPDATIFPVPKAGLTLPCYDGQNVFDADHPARDAAGNLVTVSNAQEGTGSARLPMDTSRAIRPVIRAGRATPATSSPSPGPTTRRCS